MIKGMSNRPWQEIAGHRRRGGHWSWWELLLFPEKPLACWLCLPSLNQAGKRTSAKTLHPSDWQLYGGVFLTGDRCERAHPFLIVNVCAWVCCKCLGSDPWGPYWIAARGRSAQESSAGCGAAEVSECRSLCLGVCGDPTLWALKLM